MSELATAGVNNNQRIVGLLLDAFEDLDASLEGLDAKELEALPIEGSCFAWTYAHVASQLDAWINVRFGNGRPHKLFESDTYGIGASGRVGHSWSEIHEAVEVVRRRAADYLGHVSEQLETQVPYNGSFEHLRESGLHIAHAVLRLAAHHFVHIGEIVTLRKRVGHKVSEPPRLLNRTV